MKRVDQLLSHNPFKIDESACHAAALIIRPFQGDQVSGPWVSQPIDTQLLFKLAFISVCHQINWDFLQSRLALHLLAREDSSLLSLLCSVSAKDVGRWLEGYEKPDRIRAQERAALLRNIGATIRQELNGQPMRLFDESRGFISGEQGFLKQLDRFAAFREDPLRKKSNVLMQELTRERILQFNDEQTIQPAIDYHIMRLYLRTGRVVPTDIVIKNQLRGQPNPRERLVHLLREKVGNALDLTAFYAGLPVSEVNYIEWQIGRSICQVDAPNCVAKAAKPLLPENMASLFVNACPYMEFCLACEDPEWRMLREPELRKSFY